MFFSFGLLTWYLTPAWTDCDYGLPNKYFCNWIYCLSRVYIVDNMVHSRLAINLFAMSITDDAHKNLNKIKKLNENVLFCVSG